MYALCFIPFVMKKTMIGQCRVIDENQMVFAKDQNFQKCTFQHLHGLNETTWDHFCFTDYPYFFRTSGYLNTMNDTFNFLVFFKSLQRVRKYSLLPISMKHAKIFASNIIYLFFQFRFYRRQFRILVQLNSVFHI